MDRRKNSPIWSYFTVQDFENKTARCDLCGFIMSYRGTISNLQNHIVRKHPTVDLKVVSTVKSVPTKQKESSLNVELIENECQQPNSEPQTILVQPSTSTGIETSEKTIKPASNQFQSSITTYTHKKINVTQKKKIDQNLLRLFTEDYQPFSVVEDSGFRSFVNSLNPSYELSSRKVIANNFIPAAYEVCKIKVYEKMKNVERVCLTTDCWSSSNMDSYLALTAHFINDNIELEAVLLDCLPIEGSHTSKNLSETIKKITDTYSISEKILIVVSDNAANIVSAIKELKWKHFGCYAHTINLVVHNALEVVKNLLDKSRHIVTFFKRSNLASEKIVKFQKDNGINVPKKLIHDIPRRWNSSFYMLERLVLLQDAVKTSLALSDKAALNLTPEEWKQCGELVDVLRPFEEITRQMSSERFVTGSQIIVLTGGIAHVCSLLRENSYSADFLAVVESLQKGIANRFKNIELSNTAGICTFLDPRFKQHAFTSQTAYENIKETVTKKVSAEYNKDKRALEVDQQEQVDDPPAKKIKHGLSIWELFDSKIEKQPQANPTSSAIMEVQRFAQERVIKRKDDPLKWWQTNQHHYPYLAKMVKQYFPMVATSVPCERVFSKAGLLINDRRTRLKTSKVRQLIFLKENS